MLNEDYLEILQCFAKNEVRFLVVGAYALAAHGYPRATGDIDIWVEASTENSKKIYHALDQFGAPLHELEPKTFSNMDLVFQIGVAPRRIDIITSIDGVEFKAAYRNRRMIQIESNQFPFISKKDLIKNKQSTSRAIDALDAESLAASGD